jgi:hypothetical protein
MAETCKICQKVYDADVDFNRHLKAHKIRVIEYYQQHLPRYDLFDNSIINYKNKEQYFSTDFNNKNNLKNWLKAQSIEKQQEYCKNFLIKRKEKKNLEYTPSQVELRSVLSPSVIYLQEIFGDYYKLAEEIGFKNKYVYPKSLDNLPKLQTKDSIIYIDPPPKNNFI